MRTEHCEWANADEPDGNLDTTSGCAPCNCRAGRGSCSAAASWQLHWHCHCPRHCCTGTAVAASASGALRQSFDEADEPTALQPSDSLMLRPAKSESQQTWHCQCHGTAATGYCTLQMPLPLQTEGVRYPEAMSLRATKQYFCIRADDCDSIKRTMAYSEKTYSR